MNPHRKLKRTQERKFSAHHMLINAASRANDVAKKQEPGYFYDNLASITFSALAIEALCNSIGEQVINDWSDFENSPPIAKLRILTNHLSIEYKKDTEPWATARWLIRFRNLIAHAKPQVIVEETLLTQEEHDKRLYDIPESKLEKQINFLNASRALQAAEKIRDILIDKIPIEDRLGLSVDGWSGSTTMHDD